eukprot:gene5855-8078_t
MKWKSSAIICLGQMLYKNITMPLSLQARVDQAISVYSKISNETASDLGGEITLIMTGGDVCSAGISESECMKEYILSSTSIYASQILTECHSRNTIENAFNCAEIVKNLKCETIFLITNDFHMPRAKLIFDCVFNDTVDEIVAVSADSLCDKSTRVIRAIEDRPIDMNMWSYVEKLEVEYNAISNIKDRLHKYGIFVPFHKIVKAKYELSILMNATRNGN